MKSYTQLTQEERYHIWVLQGEGYNQSQIAEKMRRCKSTISRELKRGTGGCGYRPAQAQRFAETRWEAGRAKVKPRISRQLWRRVDNMLSEQWSPEQISGWLRGNGGVSVSHECIYQHVWQDKAEGGDLHHHLRCQKRRRKCYGTHSQRGSIVGRVGIEARPAVVDKRIRIGDWELDTVIGKGGRGALVTATERKTRFTVIRAVERKTAEGVSRALREMLLPYVKRVLTLTADNGKEFAGHRWVAEQLAAMFYFAHPYASWERGLNENTNGLIRQYFPKRMKLTGISRIETNRVMRKLNNRPRKCLAFKTPNQVFLGIDPPVALAS